MVNIHTINQTRTDLPFEDFIRHIRKVLKNYSLTDNVEVELKIVGKTAMQRLNREFRNKNYATDVLSFPIWPDLPTIRAQSDQSIVSLGTVLVCLPVAAQEAAENNETTDQRIAFLIEHSLLHLMGFHHEGDN